MHEDMTFSETDRRILEAHTYALQIHSNALAAHCECLGMNAENMWAAIANSNPVYLQKDYMTMMKKWGLVDEMNKPII